MAPAAPFVRRAPSAERDADMLLELALERVDVATRTAVASILEALRPTLGSTDDISTDGQGNAYLRWRQRAFVFVYADAGRADSVQLFDEGDSRVMWSGERRRALSDELREAVALLLT